MAVAALMRMDLGVGSSVKVDRNRRSFHSFRLRRRKPVLGRDCGLREKQTESRSKRK